MKSPLIFRVFKNEQIHVVKQFIDKDQILFGHEAEVDVDLDSEDVSPIHCLIEKRGMQYFICDLGSTGGTSKNGQVVLDEPITSGDEFTIGPFRIIFFIGAPKPVHSPKTGSEVVIPPTVTPAVPTSAPAAPPIVLAASPAVTETGQSSKMQPATLPEVTPPHGSGSTKLTPVDDQSAETPRSSTVVAPGGSQPSKPQIHSAIVGSKIISTRGQLYLKSKTKKGAKTFAPEGQVKDLREYIKPGKGKLVEVLVAWNERILTTHHFTPLGLKKLGRGQAIQTPEGAAPKNWTFLDFTSGGTQVRTSSDMKVEVQNSDELKTISDSNYVLKQNETVFVTLANSMQLIVRFAPVAPAVPFESAAILSSSELTGILGAFIIAALTSLIVSVTAPKPVDKEEEVQRVAQVIFEKPPTPVAKIPIPPPTPQESPKEIPPPPPPKVKPVEPKKIVEAEKQKAATTKGDPTKPDQKAQVAQRAGRANEVKPKDSKFTKKQFTSTKQGGAVKTGDASSANARSKQPDPKNQGLLSAFGSGGVRSKMDQAYSGSGELIGEGAKANGTSGFSENRAGDDVGNKFKDTGAGGKGTATQGIAGIGTKGRGTGMSEFGTGTGLGGKDQVAVQPGGAEEEFVGSIDREAVRRVVRSALAAFKSCYDREYRKDSKVAGKVVISWEIHEKGVARNAKVVGDKSTIGNSTVEECVRSRMLSLRFPEPPAGTIAEVTYPFLFQGQK